MPRALALAALAAALCAPPAADAAPEDRDLLAAVQKHLAIYTALGSRRDPSERVVVQQQAIEVWFMRPVPPAEQDAAVCEGARWLLTGRLAESTGAGALFADRSELKRISLVFYELDTEVDRNRTGRYDQKRTATPHLRFTITRDRAMQLDPKALEQTLRGTRCGSLAQSLLDELWIRR